MKKFYALLIATVLFTGMIFTVKEEAEAAKKLRMSSHYPAGYFLNNGFRRIAERVKKETNGEIDITFYEGSSLGSYDQIFQEIMRGTIDIQAAWGTPRFNKKFEIQALPGLAAGFEQIYKLTNPDSPFTQYLKSVYEECGTVYLGSLVDTLACVAIRKGKEVKHPFDTSNKECVIRVVEFTGARKFWAGLGYQIATTQFAELFSAMQTGVIDGDMGAGMESTWLRYRDVTSQLIEYPNGFWLLDFVISKKTWDSFDDKTKEIFIKAYEAERESVYNDAIKSYEDYKKKLQEDGGITIVSPTPEDIKSINEAAYKYAWPEAEKVMGTEVLPAIRAFLGD